MIEAVWVAIEAVWVAIEAVRVVIEAVGGDRCSAGDDTAIPLLIKVYVALWVGVAVILSQRPTPGTIYRVFYKSFLVGKLTF